METKKFKIAEEMEMDFTISLEGGIRDVFVFVNGRKIAAFFSYPSSNEYKFVVDTKSLKELGIEHHKDWSLD